MSVKMPYQKYASPCLRAYMQLKRVIHQLQPNLSRLLSMSILKGRPILVQSLDHR
jgi:hypothetical protein